MSAQGVEKFPVQGVVREFGGADPLEGCVISIPDLDLWAVSDARGTFRFAAVPRGSYTFEASCLGFERAVRLVVVDHEIADVEFRLRPASLKLETVTVTATPGKGLGTSSVIDRRAIDHLQASSLTDVLQLLPGTLTANSDLTNPVANVPGIRDLPWLQTSRNANGLNASGVGVYLDGMPVDNQALLVGQSALAFGQPVGQGIDLRTVPTDNIESVEVIRGVASARYGNLSSGAILVKTQSGLTPYEVRLRVTPESKLVSLNKGFALGPQKGFLNLDAGYARAVRDIRTLSDAYDRGVFSMKYVNTFNRNRTPLNFQAVVRGYLSRDSERPDADNISRDERASADDRSLSVNVNGAWLLNKPWITTLNAFFDATATRQYARKKTSTSELGVANPGATEDGEYLTEFTPDSYLTDIRNLSMAYYTHAGLMAELARGYGSVFNKIIAGADWYVSGNTGKGLYFEGVRPMQFRPQPFDDVPFQHRVAVFAEDQLRLPLGETALTLQAGVRVEYMPVDFLKRDYAVDPRFNAKYELVRPRDSGFLRQLSLRGGWGLLTTLPGLGYLYPFPIYYDRNSFSWGGSPQGGPMAVWTTVVTPRSELQNPDLKMQYSRNIEAGLDFNLGGVRGSVVYYQEKMRNGYSLRSIPMPIGYREYEPYSGTVPPVYIADPQHPANQILSVNGQPLAYRQAQVFHQPARPANDRQYDKWGLEYIFDFGSISAIRTTFLLNGAYLSMVSRNNDGALLFDQPYSYQKLPIGQESRYNPFLAGYKGGTALEAGFQRSRLNTKLHLITHIPRLRLVISTTLQCVWLDRSQRLSSEGVYRLDSEGQPVNGDFSVPVADATFYKDPDYYMNAQGEVLPFSRELYDDPVYGAAFRSYLRSANSSNYFVESSFSPYFMANIHITKEIGNVAQLSFYANNFTNSRPLMKIQNLGDYTRVNTEIYFGVELKLRF